MNKLNYFESIYPSYLLTNITNIFQYHFFLTRKQKMQQSQSSSYIYPSSPTPTMPFYDSGYTSFDYSSPSPAPFHFTSCPYSNESFCMPVQSCKFIVFINDYFNLWFFFLQFRSIVLQSNIIFNVSTIY